jgi:hypothetical protein
VAEIELAARGKVCVERLASSPQQRAGANYGNLLLGLGGVHFSKLASASAIAATSTALRA